MKSYAAILIPAVLFFFFTSCSNKAVYEKSINIRNGIWAIENVPQFVVPIDDTARFYDLFVRADISPEFKTQNLWLYYHIEAPDGTTQNDTIEYYLFDHKGVPSGEKHGDNIRYNLLYKAYVRFPSKGDYTIRVKHGMRPKQEPMITEISLYMRNSRIKTDTAQAK